MFLSLTLLVLSRVPLNSPMQQDIMHNSRIQHYIMLNSRIQHYIMYNISVHHCIMHNTSMQHCIMYDSSIVIASAIKLYLVCFKDNTNLFFVLLWLLLTWTHGPWTRNAFRNALEWHGLKWV